MMKHTSSAWIIGFLLATRRFYIVNCEEKVKRQLIEGTPLALTSVPKTSFSCDLLGPGYYADMETQCQVFHVCQADRMDSFICPAGTMFNQRVFVCDWTGNVDCDSSPDFYSLNSRIGSDEPFHTSVFVNLPRRVGIAPDAQFGSPSQARVKTVKPDSLTGRHSGRVRIASNIRVGNTLIPSTLFVEIPRFIAKEAETGGRRTTTETIEIPATTEIKSKDASISSQNVLTRGNGSEKQKKNQTYGPGAGEEGYLPTSPQKPGSGKDERDAYLPLEGSGEGPSSEQDGYLPTEVTNAVSYSNRGSYLPEDTPKKSSPVSAKGSYLPEESTGQPASSNYLPEKPPQPTIPDVSFLLPPPSSPDLPNSILAAFSLPTIDEYSPVPPATQETFLPPMNLLPLSNESAPPSEAGRLPSTTESYGVLEEEDNEDDAGRTESPATRSRGRQGFGRAQRRRPKEGDQGKNAIVGGKKTVKRPITEAPTTSAIPEFQYNFDSVRKALQKRLTNVEPFDVPAETVATSGGATVAPPSGATRGGGAAPSPWLYALAKVPM